MDIRQGNRLIASQNTLLGEFLVEGLSHKLKGQVNIEGSIIIDQNGILTGEAKDLDTNSYKKIGDKRIYGFISRSDKLHEIKCC